MNFIDWILIIPLVYAAWEGFNDGIASQLGGLIALVAGVYLAFWLGGTVGGWLGLESFTAAVVGFLIVLVIVVAAAVLLGKVVGKLFHLTGLGAIDRVGGLLLGVFKMALLLSVILMAFDLINRYEKIIAQERIDHSALYKPLMSLADKTLPYFDRLTDSVLPETPSESEVHE